MEKNFPEVMIHFYKKNNLSKIGEGPEVKFNGPSIKFILSEELEEILPESSSSFITYLRKFPLKHDLKSPYYSTSLP